jgi:hypothetical protein
MKLKSLAVITLLVLGCSAAFAQGSVTLGFSSTNGQLACNYEVLKWSGPDNLYLTGVDNYSYCDEPNVGISGFKVGPGAPVSPSNPAYEYVEAIYDSFTGQYTGYLWTVLTATKPSKLLQHYGWYGYIGFDGYEFLGNYGYLSAAYPGSGSSRPVSHQSTLQAAQEALRAKGILK